MTSELSSTVPKISKYFLLELLHRVRLVGSGGYGLLKVK